MKSRNFLHSLTFFTILAAMLYGCNQTNELSPEEAKSIAKEAYVYGLPMVMNYKTMYNYTLNEQSPEYKGPFNQKSCEARLFTPDDKAVVTPNSDTPYCMFWIDLRDEPQVISVPEMEPERFYHFQLIDLYTHNFAYLGTLTTGNKAGNYLIANQDWEGEKPRGINEIIYCETDLIFVAVRTQLMGDEDLPNVKAIQDAYGVVSLNSYLGEKTIVSNRNEDIMEWHDGDEFTIAMFPYLNYMLNLTSPLEAELELRNRMARLGIGTKEGFELNKFDEEIQKAIEEGVAEGLQEIKDFAATHANDPLISAKLFGTRDFLIKSAQENFNLNNFYILRAVAAERGLYGNSGEEAIYPTYLINESGDPFNAATSKYTLTFEKDKLPPVKAFWSFSMYDGKTQLFIDNPLNRYLLNSSSLNEFVFEEDGSLTLYIQKDSPGTALESNWLPAPDGPFYCVMRLYGPKEEALSGVWIHPPLVKATN